jgi:hypothetical protein
MLHRSIQPLALTSGLVLGLVCSTPAEARPAPPATKVLIILSARQQAPLYQRTVIAIRGQISSLPVRIEVRWLDDTARNTARHQRIALKLSRRAGVLAVLWFDLAVRAQAFFLLNRCSRPVVRNLENTQASGRVESLAVIVGTTVTAVLQSGTLHCPPAPAAPPPPAITPLAAPPPAPPPGPPPLRVARRHQPRTRWLISAAYAAGFAYLRTTMRSDIRGNAPMVGGMGLGPQSFQLEVGYFVTRRLLLSAAARVGGAFSDLSDRPVIPWALLGRARYYVAGRPCVPFGLYLGIEAGVGAFYSSLVMSENKRDTFTHGPMLMGALIGIELGRPGFAWFLEIENVAVFPRQTTYQLGVNTGFLVRF